MDGHVAEEEEEEEDEERSEKRGRQRETFKARRRVEGKQTPCLFTFARIYPFFSLDLNLTNRSPSSPSSLPFFFSSPNPQVSHCVEG